MLIRTTAITKIAKLDKRIKIIQGGTSAGKTFGVLPLLIDIATKHENIEISIVAESIPHLRRAYRTKRRTRHRLFNFNVQRQRSTR